MEQKVVLSEPKPLVLLGKGRIKMKIAICDDEQVIIKLVKPKLYEYANSHRIDLVVDEYYSGEALVTADKNYDIIFLDYQMGRLNGLDAAKILRERNAACAIIFLTSYTHFVFDAFKVNAYRFLIKPITERKLFDTMDDYFKMHGDDYPLLLKCDRDTICIETEDIVYLEADNKHCKLHLPKETLCCAKTMALVSKLLPKSHFFKVHRAFIVNFNYILKYNSEEITLKTGEKIPVSRKYLTPFKEAYRVFSTLR